MSVEDGLYYVGMIALYDEMLNQPPYRTNRPLEKGDAYTELCFSTVSTGNQVLRKDLVS